MTDTVAYAGVEAIPRHSTNALFTIIYHARTSYVVASIVVVIVMTRRIIFPMTYTKKVYTLKCIHKVYIYTLCIDYTKCIHFLINLRNSICFLKNIYCSSYFCEKVLNTRNPMSSRTELLVMSALYILGRGASFRSCQDMCNISTSEVRKFFHVFLNAIVDMRDEQIYMPRSLTELNGVSCFYEHDGLPGCFGSVDVVHVKWSNCPSGDFNRAKGKESYPSLGFQCITDYNRRIMAIYGPHFGTRNDMDIVKTDPYVNSLTTKPLYRDTKWHYYNDDGEVFTEKGMYLICDNGYLRWPTTICPFTQASNTSSEGYFSSNIESVRKDVECTFGIIKKRWRILNNGFFYRDIKVCENIFVTCCWLNNFLLDVMERSTERVGRGAPIARDGIWLSSSTTRNIVVEDMRMTQTRKDMILAKEFSRRRNLLVKHLHVFRQKGDLPE